MEDDNIDYRENYRLIRHEMERIQFDFLSAFTRDVPISEHDIYRRVKIILKQTPVIGLTGDAYWSNQK